MSTSSRFPFLLLFHNRQYLDVWKGPDSESNTQEFCRFAISEWVNYVLIPPVPESPIAQVSTHFLPALYQCGTVSRLMLLILRLCPCLRPQLSVYYHHHHYYYFYYYYYHHHYYSYYYYYHHQLSEKNEEPYHITITWIRTLLSFEILRSVHTCVRGSRTLFHKIP